MGLLIHLVNQVRSTVSQLRDEWSRPRFRQRGLIVCAIWLMLLLLCGIPTMSERPPIDLAAGSVRATSAMLDAVGVIHHLDEAEGTLAFPGVVADVRPVAGISLLSLLALACVLIWSVRSQPSRRTFLGIVAVSLLAVVIANVLSLTSLMLAARFLGLESGSGVGWAASQLFRISFLTGLIGFLLVTVDRLLAQWCFRQAVQNNDGSSAIPEIVRPLSPGPHLVVAVCLIVAFGMWLVGRSLTRESLITSYRDVAEVSLTAGDLATAEVAIERLMQLDDRASAHRFLAAQQKELEGDVEGAEEMIREIVGADGRRYEPAHRWLAQRIAARRGHVANDDSRSRTSDVAHLEEATELDASNINAHLALAESYLQRRSPEQAVRELEKVVDQRPDLRLTLARLAIIAGQTETARLHGELARTFYADEVQSFPLSIEARMRLAASQIFLEQFQDAVTVLLKGFELTGHDAYQNGLGVAYLVWHDTLARQAGDPARLLSLLEESLKYDPDNAETLRRVALLATAERTSGPAIDLLTRSLANRPIPASVHFILGTNAYQHGRLSNAQRHLEEAHRLDPQNSEILNNLAWVLSMAEDPDLDRALDLIMQAIEQDPQSASLRETRGQIFARLGRWKEAVADLESAMQVMRQHPGIHATLATAYDALGDPRLAEEHRRLAVEYAATPADAPAN